MGYHFYLSYSQLTLKVKWMQRVIFGDSYIKYNLFKNTKYIKMTEYKKEPHKFDDDKSLWNIEHCLADIID